MILANLFYETLFVKEMPAVQLNNRFPCFEILHANRAKRKPKLPVSVHKRLNCARVKNVQSTVFFVELFNRLSQLVFAGYNFRYLVCYIIKVVFAVQQIQLFFNFVQANFAFIVVGELFAYDLHFLHHYFHSALLVDETHHVSNVELVIGRTVPHIIYTVVEKVANVACGYLITRQRTH